MILKILFQNDFILKIKFCNESNYNNFLFFLQIYIQLYILQWLKTEDSIQHWIILKIIYYWFQRFCSTMILY